MTQYDGLLYKSGLSSSIRRKQSTRLSNEMLQVNGNEMAQVMVKECHR